MIKISDEIVERALREGSSYGVGLGPNERIFSPIGMRAAIEATGLPTELERIKVELGQLRQMYARDSSQAGRWQQRYEYSEAGRRDLKNKLPTPEEASALIAGADVDDGLNGPAYTKGLNKLWAIVNAAHERKDNAN